MPNTKSPTSKPLNPVSIRPLLEGETLGLAWLGQRSPRVELPQQNCISDIRHPCVHPF